MIKDWFGWALKMKILKDQRRHTPKVQLEFYYIIGSHKPMVDKKAINIEYSLNVKRTSSKWIDLNEHRHIHAYTKEKKPLIYYDGFVTTIIRIGNSFDIENHLNSWLQQRIFLFIINPNELN